MSTLDDFSTRELQRMRRKLDGLRGVGVVNTRENITITPPGAVVTLPTYVPTNVYRVKFLTVIGHGKYRGATLKPPTSDVSLTGDLVAADLGATNESCLILADLEVGNSGTNTKGWDTAGRQLYGIGVFVQRRAADGLLVVQVNQVQDKTCP